MNLPLDVSSGMLLFISIFTVYASTGADLDLRTIFKRATYYTALTKA